MKMRARNELPTIWEVPDLLWERILLPLLNEFDPPSKRGRPRADPRRCLNGMIYRARTGCQWNHLPKEFGDDATVHRTLKRWEQKQIFDRIWALLIYHCEELTEVHWEWQSADGCLNKAKFIGKKGAKAERIPQPHKKNRKKASALTPATEGKWVSMGVKQLLLVEGDGGPLAACIAGANIGANINDHLLLAATLDAIVVERPEPSAEPPQHLCLDKGFDNAPTRAVVKERGYTEHIRRIGEEKKDEEGKKTYPARRWVTSV